MCVCGVCLVWFRSIILLSCNLYSNMFLPIKYHPFLCTFPLFFLFFFVLSFLFSFHSQLTEATSVISLNSAELTFDSVEIEQSGTVQTGSADLNADTEIAKITFESELKSGEAVLRIKYAGILNDKMKGFYRSYYKNSAGEQTLMATTQFEATDARRALPCWDEPAVKATFSVTLEVPKGQTAVSNMPIISEKDVADAADLVEITYDVTPIMSTYLLAFVIGEFDYVETKCNAPEEVTVRVYTLKGKKHEGEFALDAAARCLPFYAEYFEIGYPLPKLDMLAIPDFAAGAMENWGCVTYRETALLVDPQNSAQSTKQWVGLVVAHELAHQWFGNLVTMDWWTHLWLNEGFATWIEYLAVDKLYPDWQIWTQFVSLDLGRSFNLDALENSHPIEVEVGHPDEVNEIFDAISYSKGSCVIRMLHEYLGAEDFRKGLAKYLARHQFKNTFTEDLWAALAEQSGKPVNDVMSTWTKQTGYPVVTVERDGNTLNVSQVRFLKSKAMTVEDDPNTWAVPLSVVVADSKGGVTTQEVLFDQRTNSVQVQGDDIAWIKINQGQSGHYRVKYPQSMLDALIAAIEAGDDRLSARDRIGLQDDAFALTGAGLMSMDQLFRLLGAFKNETHFTVWQDLTANLSTLKRILKDSDVYDDFCAYAQKLYANIAASVGWDADEKESSQTALLRSTVLGMLSGLGDQATTQEALSRFDKFVTALAEKKDTKDILAPDLRAIAYRSVIAERGDTGFDAIVKIMEETELNEERVRCVNALGSGKEEKTIKRAIEFVMSDKVRDQDKMYGLRSVLFNRHGGALAWEHIKGQWPEFVKKFKGGFLIARIISFLNTFSSFERADEVEKFYQENEAPGAERGVKQAVESIRWQATWLKRDEDNVRKFLASQ
jgi:puromycin-sensitive aminopeptidase